MRSYWDVQSDTNGVVSIFRPPSTGGVAVGNVAQVSGAGNVSRQNAKGMIPVV
jgi:hypothetical protein